MERARLEMLVAAGASQRSVARKFGVNFHAVNRHWSAHISDERKGQLVAGPTLKLSELAAKAAEEGLGLLDYLALVRATLVTQFLAASEAGDRNGTAAVAGRLLQCLGMQAQISGEIAKTSSSVTNNVAIINHPLVADLQALLIRTLQPFPEARTAVVGALRDMSARVLQSATSTALPALTVGGSNA